MLQNIVDKTGDLVFCSGVTLETIYCILYIVLSVSDCLTPFHCVIVKQAIMCQQKVIESNCTDKIIRSWYCSTPPLSTPLSAMTHLKFSQDMISLIRFTYKKKTCCRISSTFYTGELMSLYKV